MSKRSFFNDKAGVALIKNVQALLSKKINEADLHEITEEEIRHMLKIEGIRIPDGTPNSYVDEIIAGVVSEFNLKLKKFNNDLDEAKRTIVPYGCILIWSGAINNIPAGWALCDGTKGTPDLRARFVLGADPSTDSNYTVGQIGGEAEHKLTSNEMPAHSHSQQVGVGSGTSASTYSMTIQTGTSSTYYSSNVERGQLNGSKVSNRYQYSNVRTIATGGSVAHNNMPPYYALAYIMKL